MEPGLSIQIVWPLAAQEAIAADFEHIKPSHLFLAILKFAEMDVRIIERLVDDQEAPRILLSEHEKVRSGLREYLIEVPEKSKEIRYSLRRRLGKGGHPYDGQRVLHRSTSSREICNKAESLSRKDNESQWCAVHLLHALWENPSTDISSVLSEAGVTESSQEAKDTPFLDRYGRDLSAKAREMMERGDLNDGIDAAKDPVCKVVMADILGSEKNNALLIQKGKRSPNEIVEIITRYFVGESAPPGAKIKRIMELEILPDGMESLDVRLEELEHKITPLFDEIAGLEHLVIFLSKFQRFLRRGDEAGFSVMLKALLSKETVRCIAGIDETSYRKYIEKDREWKRLLRPVWIHDLNVPFQL